MAVSFPPVLSRHLEERRLSGDSLFLLALSADHCERRRVLQCNIRRYREALNNLSPADDYFGRAQQIQNLRVAIKHKTLALRRAPHLLTVSLA